MQLNAAIAVQFPIHFNFIKQTLEIAAEMPVNKESAFQLLANLEQNLISNAQFDPEIAKKVHQLNYI